MIFLRLFIFAASFINAFYVNAKDSVAEPVELGRNVHDKINAQVNVGVILATSKRTFEIKDIHFNERIVTNQFALKFDAIFMFGNREIRQVLLVRLGNGECAEPDWRVPRTSKPSSIILETPPRITTDMIQYIQIKTLAWRDHPRGEGLLGLRIDSTQRARMKALPNPKELKCYHDLGGVLVGKFGHESTLICQEGIESGVVSIMSANLLEVSDLSISGKSKSTLAGIEFVTGKIRNTKITKFGMKMREDCRSELYAKSANSAKTSFIIESPVNLTKMDYIGIYNPSVGPGQIKWLCRVDFTKYVRDNFEQELGDVQSEEMVCPPDKTAIED